MHQLSAQISIDADLGDHTYNQSFNSVYPIDEEDRESGEDLDWINNSTLIGWYAAGEFSDNEYFTEYRISDGTETSNRRLYSVGPNQDDLNATDRALGFHTSGTTGNTSLAVLFENTGLEDIRSISIHLTGEQWRTMGGCSKGQQRIKVGYLVGVDLSNQLNNLVLGPNLVMNGHFINFPEAVLVNMDTTSSNEFLDGNSISNQSIISIKVPISLEAGEQLLLRFLDEETNCGNTDPPIALDDLTLIFSTQATTTEINPPEFSDFANHNINIAEYLSQGIAKNIPENKDDRPDPDYPVYVAPSPAEYDTWQTILTDFFVENDFEDISSRVSVFGYEMITYPKPEDIDNPYRILRKNDESTNYWGTMVLNPNAGETSFSNNLNLQSPHSANDQDTGIQGASVFMHTDAYSYVIAGADRCSNDVATGCRGRGKCNNGSGDYHSTADLSHDSHNLLDLSMRIIALDNNHSVFIQLHGFGGGRDFNFVISNGTDQTPTDESSDFAFKLATELREIEPENIFEKIDPFDVRVPHKGDEIDELRGFTNNQGKWLNNINVEEEIDPCLDGNSDVSSGRFIHLEQYDDIRERHEMHILLSEAILRTLDIELPIELKEFEASLKPDGTVWLNWVIDSEINHSHYEIERSYNGTDFHSIAMIDHPKSSDPLNYGYHDKTILLKTAYYRLKQVDMDGKISYFEIKRVSPDFYRNGLVCYPNPFHNKVKIKSALNESIYLIDNSGNQILFTKYIENDGTIVLDLSGISRGIYYLKTQGTTLKLIKR